MHPDGRRDDRARQAVASSLVPLGASPLPPRAGGRKKAATAIAADADPRPALQIEAEALPDISESFEVDAVPYFILLRVSDRRRPARRQRSLTEPRLAYRRVTRS